MSIDGDYAIVGAIGDDDKGSNAGAAYVFLRSGTTWTEQAKLKANDGQAGDLFGNSVSISGAYVIVGATGRDEHGGNTGGAYIFARSGSSWYEQASLISNDIDPHDFFGGSVSISGAHAIVGKTGDDDKGAGAGAAYVFVRSGSSWYQQRKITASNGGASDAFGGSVAIDGNYAIVGAIREDTRGVDAGAAYTFYRYQGGTNNWGEQAKITASDGQAADYFGYSVDIDGDYAIVGAYKEDDKGTNAGSAYVFSRSGTSWTEQQKLLASDGEVDDWFGYSVSIDGDYAIVGAYAEDDKGSNAGAAYFFEPGVPEVCLSAKVHLQGALLLSGTSLMNDDLRAASPSLIPSAEPYTSLSGFTHAGSGGGETAPASVFTTTGNDAIVDWVFVELRDKNDSASVLETRSALLQRDGDIVDAADGTSKVCFTGLADPEVYVSVRHRNHLGVMINATKTLTTGGTTADFSTETLYGTNATKTVNGVSALWAGDINANGNVKYGGANDDDVLIVNDVLNASGNTGFLGSGAVPGYIYNNQYRSTDINMNGIVKYGGSGDDGVFILNNVLNYPANTGFLGSGAVPGYGNMNAQLP